MERLRLWLMDLDAFFCVYSALSLDLVVMVKMCQNSAFGVLSHSFSQKLNAAHYYKHTISIVKA